MTKALKFFSRMPPSLQVMAVVFILLPAWAAAFVGNPLHLTWQGPEATTSVAIALAYWILPPALVLGLVFRKFVAIPIFAVECLAIVAHALFMPQTTGIEVQVVRYLLLAILVAGGIFVLNRDILAPLMAKHERFWRKRPRYYCSEPVFLHMKSGKKLRGILQDVSVSGVGLSVSSEDVKDELSQNQSVRMRTTHNKPLELNLKVVWNQDFGALRHIGMEADSQADMLSLLEQHRDRLHSGGLFSRTAARLWAKSSVRRGVLTAWAMSVFASAGMPGCGSFQQNLRGAHDASQTAQGEGVELDDTATDNAVLDSAMDASADTADLVIPCAEYKAALEQIEGLFAQYAIDNLALVSASTARTVSTGTLSFAQLGLMSVHASLRKKVSIAEERAFLLTGCNVERQAIRAMRSRVAAQTKIDGLDFEYGDSNTALLQLIDEEKNLYTQFVTRVTELETHLPIAPEYEFLSSTLKDLGGEVQQDTALEYAKNVAGLDMGVGLVPVSLPELGGVKNAK